MKEYTMEQFCEILKIHKGQAIEWLTSGEIRPAIIIHRNGTRTFKYYDAHIEKAQKIIKNDGILMSVEDIAQRLNFSYSTAYKYLLDLKISPKKKNGGKFLYSNDGGELLEKLAKHQKDIRLKVRQNRIKGDSSTSAENERLNREICDLKFECDNLKDKLSQAEAEIEYLKKIVAQVADLSFENKTLKAKIYELENQPKPRKKFLGIF